jgi:hypothetical protein
MIPARALLLAGATLLVLGVNADAQMLGPGMMGPGMMGPGMAPPGAQQMPPCMNEFVPLRTEAEKRAGAIKAGIDKKVPREDICNLFKRFSEAEARVAKFLKEKQTACGVPPDAVKQVTANHAKTLKTRDQVCAVGPTAGPRPTGPGLSEALGTARGPGGPQDAPPPGGTFDTLTGNVLSR